MPIIPISSLPDDARIWVFGISPAIDERAGHWLLERVDTFLGQWAAHGTPIVCARELLHGSFLVVAVDHRSETSGCSIDRMFGLLQQIERELGVAVLDGERVFVRHGSGAVDALSRDSFRANADPHTTVFDTTADRLGDVRSGHWERHAEDSWHAQLLRGQAM